jgi:hypothetical protein
LVRAIEIKTPAGNGIKQQPVGGQRSGT